MAGKELNFSNQNIPQEVFQNLITACLFFGFILFNDLMDMLLT